MLVGAAAFLGSEVVLSPVVSGCLPSCGGWGVVGVAASRTKTFRNQNHRFQSRFVYCKLFGVYAGVIFSCHTVIHQPPPLGHQGTMKSKTDSRDAITRGNLEAKMGGNSETVLSHLPTAGN